MGNLEPSEGSANALTETLKARFEQAGKQSRKPKTGKLYQVQEDREKVGISRPFPSAKYMSLSLFLFLYNLCILAQLGGRRSSVPK